MSNRLIEKESHRLFSDERAQLLFDSLINRNSARPAIIWIKDRSTQADLPVLAKLPWEPDFVDRLASGTKAGLNPLHDQGFYYALDFSSIFAASICLHLDCASTVLDMCSSPGGKAIFAWRCLKPQALVCNEVIGKRIPALISNLERLNIFGSKVVSHDSKFFADALSSMFDLVICDVPCSGQSLLVKGAINPGSFHPATVNKNSNRQKRIIANSAKAVRGGGYLCYMTCTFSRSENEDVIAWFLKKFPQFQSVKIEHLEPHRSHLSDEFCYRLWPFEGLGAGAFTTLLVNRDDQVLTPDLGGLRILREY